MTWCLLTFHLPLLLYCLGPFSFSLRWPDDHVSDQHSHVQRLSEVSSVDSKETFPIIPPNRFFFLLNPFIRSGFYNYLQSNYFQKKCYDHGWLRTIIIHPLNRNCPPLGTYGHGILKQNWGSACEKESNWEWLLQTTFCCHPISYTWVQWFLNLSPY